MTAPRLGDRSLFPLLEPRAYLNHAGISPPSEPVRQAIGAAVDDFARRGGAAVGAAVERKVRLRARVAELLGGRPEDVALTTNTSSGIQAIALDFPWRRGDRILLVDGEFPANVTPWQQAAALFELEIGWIPLEPFLRSEEEGLSHLDRELARGARLLAVSAVQFRSGLRMPIAGMASRCAAAGAEIFVDAVQGAGCLPVDVRGIDYLAAGAHKWLMGVLGAGFLWVRPERVGALVPRTASWLSHEDPVRFLVEGPGLVRYDRPIRRRADLVEGGGLPEVAMAAFLASLEVLLGLGIPAVERHVTAYLDRLEPELIGAGLPQPAIGPPGGALRDPLGGAAAGPPGLVPRPRARVARGRLLDAGRRAALLAALAQPPGRDPGGGPRGGGCALRRGLSGRPSARGRPARRQPDLGAQAEHRRLEAELGRIGGEEGGHGQRGVLAAEPLVGDGAELAPGGEDRLDQLLHRGSRRQRGADPEQVAVQRLGVAEGEGHHGVDGAVDLVLGLEVNGLGVEGDASRGVLHGPCLRHFRAVRQYPAAGTRNARTRSYIDSR